MRQRDRGAQREQAGGETPASRTRRRERARAVALVLVAIGFGLIAATAGLRIANAGKVLPGTEVAGIALGGKSEAASRGRLASLRMGNRVVIVSRRGRRWVILGSDIGLRVDKTATVTRALRAGRVGPLGGFVSSLPALLSPRSVEPIYAHDRAALARSVAGIARDVDVQSSRGSLSIDPQTLRVTVVAPRAGKLVDRRTATRAILAAFRRDARAPIGLRTRRAPVVPLRDVERVAADARAYLAEPLLLTVGGRQLALPRRRLASLLGVEPAGRAGDAMVRLGVEPQRLAALVKSLAARSDRAAVDPRIVAPAAPVEVDGKNDVRWLPRWATVRVSPGRTGRMLDGPRAARSIADAIRAGRHRAELATRPVVAGISNRAARRVRRLVGTFTTRFECCQPRVTNIRRIARVVDGTVVLPGERFSLNGVAGRRTRRGGYVPAPYIADGKVVPSVGGGVSQFSTTLYNAAYFAGLPIDFRQSHSFYISRYPPGREATLDFPSIDLTWTNDTRAPILVRAASTATSVTVTLYGDNGGRRVRADAGARRPLAGGDFAITVTRSIRYAGGRVTRESYTTRYDKPPEPE